MSEVTRRKFNNGCQKPILVHGLTAWLQNYFHFEAIVNQQLPKSESSFAFCLFASTPYNHHFKSHSISRYDRNNFFDP